ncbi:hypothetical protein, partial [Bradyrhizobium sp. 144]|uniref:hypothetical protein n=1 Tax=Bradyrhizobium sp. 144 TaxID=2782620 RepID=UPI001FFAF1D1
LRATIIAAIITSPRHRLAILIVARFPSRLSRYNPDTMKGMLLAGREPTVARDHQQCSVMV